MAALQDDAVRHFDDQNNVEIQFVDEDDFPLASITEHQASDEEFYSGASESRSQDSSEESEEEDSEVESDEENWSGEVRRRVDLEFSEEPGINISTRNLKSCLDYFELFFTQEVWQLLVSQTNLYAEQKREPAKSSVWYPVTESEMKAWISLYLNMGLVTKPNLNSYWSTDPVLSSPFFPSLMSRTRFFQILRYLHFADNTRAPPRDSADYNKLYKIQPFLDLVIARFQEVYTHERQLAIDETLIKFKGKVHFRQFIPIKPGRFGIKAFTLAESTSGYVLNSKIYTGKENNEVQKDLGRKAVMSVMQPYLDKGFYAFMDNYYTSVALFEELEERKTLACGTVRSNRVALPREICGVKEKAVKDLKRGECLYRQKGNLTWRDRKPVSVLATLPTSSTESSPVERSVKVNGKWEKKQFPRPGIIDLYNTYMGGVHVSDQRTVAYARLMKGSVWYYKVFFYMIEVCISNAHILHTKSQNHTSLRALQFRKELVSTLVQGKCFRRDAGFMQTPVALPDIRFNRDHFHYPVSNDTRSTCKVHIQNVKTIYSCAICGVRMCPEPCFQMYHTLQHYYYDGESRDGPRRLKEARGRPYQRERRRSLRN
ncbi:piggyBac transposable element-derived protein 4-like [Montipora capricornis]|uniref:piggyBac transposable element-derived protein 4-like n=1 Tax=Montipora capricornis TaxID=246305 RepID=UPI0035F0FE2A